MSVEFQINYCNSFDSAKLEVIDGKLNIVLAPNGTGKSTIAKAIELGLGGNQGSLEELMPFRYRESNPAQVMPSVSCNGSINTVKCFNEKYVDQIVFRPDELVANSFDIFIRSPRYRELEAEIDEMLASIRQIIEDSQELERMISNLKELADSFKLSRNGISRTSSGIRGLARGNTIEHIPQGLEDFSSFIQSTERINWIDWQIKGYTYMEISDACPFCVSTTTGKKDQIRRVGEKYNKSVIKNLVTFIETIEKLGDYFSIETRDRLNLIAHLSAGLEPEHEEFLAGTIGQINLFVQKLERIHTISGFNFKEDDSVLSKLNELQIDLDFFDKLDSDRTRLAAQNINHSINVTREQSGILQGLINRQRSEMACLVSKHETNINNFLEFAGYNYRVEVAGEDDKSQMKLKHIEFSSHLDGGKQHLSYGERNAFAIVLFMHECLSSSPDLIILDDPISSFDKNKKYSILEMLFRRDSSICLKGKTVLLLTHDVEPVIDTMKAVYTKFGNQTRSSYLLRRGNSLEEVEISHDDIQSFGEICTAVLATDKDDLIKAIYLRRRLEITDEKGNAYQVLSNLFHKRSETDATDSRLPRSETEDCQKMQNEVFISGCEEIRQYITSFDYQQSLCRLSHNEVLKTLYLQCSNGYEKLQLFRFLEIDYSSSVVQKYVNEAYHVENEYISQLSPLKFDLIPDYIVAICDEKVDGI
jgi:ABC-type Mn2+/Zn2+ transport system ATPase subunit